jgi:folylpolyglutamate synthase
VQVRERIRINGEPISRDSFSRYFWDCYDQLKRTQTDDDPSTPPYFRFLTIMAFHVFIQEKVCGLLELCTFLAEKSFFIVQVDVAIMEVGIGGQYDCTNIVR